MTVDSWVVGYGASTTPRDNTDENVVNDQWTTRVSLASVLTTSGETGAQHAKQHYKINYHAFINMFEQLFTGQ